VLVTACELGVFDTLSKGPLRFDRVEQRLDRVEQRLDRLETKFDEHTTLLTRHTALLTQILERLPGKS
jgi:hypothetical protein